MGTLLLQCLYAFLACVGFSLVFDVKRVRFVVLSSLIGAVGWAVFLLLTNAVSSDVWRYLLATIAVSALSELSARLFKAPATVFLLIGIVPLVPGSGLYYAMSDPYAVTMSCSPKRAYRPRPSPQTSPSASPSSPPSPA